MKAGIRLNLLALLHPLLEGVGKVGPNLQKPLLVPNVSSSSSLFSLDKAGLKVLANDVGVLEREETSGHNSEGHLYYGLDNAGQATPI